MAVTAYCPYLTHTICWVGSIQKEAYFLLYPLYDHRSEDHKVPLGVLDGTLGHQCT